ncbi:uncharacterized protein LOC134543240 [Bacillus rossius redtenbacheri]|uniref:uncharacterized protein LOC134543240 n=1 Tax=Bacillus rossius redtenbacheri TaxID=93214 RepID=UPI002FDD97CA
MLLLAVVLLAAAAAATDFRSCTNTSAPVDLRISGCSEGPCNFTSGEQVSGEVTFKVDHEITMLAPRLREKVLDDSSDLPLAQSDGCQSLLQASCPIEDGETVTYQLRFHMPAINIKSPVLITFSMADQRSTSVTCFSIAGNIV